MSLKDHCFICETQLIYEGGDLHCPRGCEDEFWMENEDRILDEIVRRNPKIVRGQNV